MTDNQHRAATIAIRFLMKWTDHSHSTLNHFETLMFDYGTHTPNIVWARTLDTMQAYLLWRRQGVLEQIVARRGGEPMGPADVARYNPSAEIMGKLNAICGHYGVHRVAIHLYLQAHLESQAAIDFPPQILTDLDALVDELYQP